jgi:hypothetical protein
MTAALKRVEADFEAFRDALRRCQSGADARPADMQDAYARLSRVRERYFKEKEGLAPPERRALAKTLEEDVFIKGMMELRQVSEHVTKRGELTIRSVDNAPIELDCETSAMAAFAAPQVTLPDIHGAPHRLDHFKQLAQAETRIAAALRKAQA